MLNREQQNNILQCSYTICGDTAACIRDSKEVDKLASEQLAGHIAREIVTKIPRYSKTYERDEFSYGPGISHIDYKFQAAILPVDEYEKLIKELGELKSMYVKAQHNERVYKERLDKIGEVIAQYE